MMPSAGGAAKSKATSIAFTLHVPPAPTTAKSRAPKYVSAGTKAVSVAVYGAGGSETTAFNVSPSSPGCVSDSSGISCTEQFPVLIGSDTFSVTAYDSVLDAQGSPQGNILSQGSANQTIVEGVANSVKVTLNGVAAKATLTISNPTPPIGTAATIPMTLTAYDADGYAIIGPYSSALQLDPGTAYSLNFAVNGASTTIVQSSSDTIGIVYTGHGTTATTISVHAQFGSTTFGSASFSPQPAFGTEVNVGTSLVGASAYRDSSYLRQTWFTEPAKGKIGTYPQGGSITEYTVPSGAAPLRLTATPMHMAFTEANGIGSVYAMGGNSISEHAVSAPNAGVYQIGGWDLANNLYFTEKNTGKIGKMDGSGSITEFSTGNADSTPAGIAYCDGSSWWFADPGANAIGRITNLGGTSYYPVPSSGAHPTEISSTYGGGLWWFTEPGVNKIARLDGNGNITEYGSPAKPVQIVADQDAVHVLTDAGTIEEFDPATGALRATYTPPASAAGPAVGIFEGLDSLIVLRSDGANGSIQDFYYE